MSEFLVSGAAITAPVEVDSESNGPILLEDEATFTGKTDILCENVLNLGIVGETVGGVFNPKLDLVESVEFMNTCTIDEGPCTSLDSVSAINLGWLTELVLDEPGGIFLDLILPEEGATANPGYLVECNTILGLIDDACTTNEGTVTIDNGVEDIVALFNTPSEKEKASCTQGNAKSGVVIGEVLILAENGLSLQVS